MKALKCLLAAVLILGSASVVVYPICGIKMCKVTICPKFVNCSNKDQITLHCWQEEVPCKDVKKACMALEMFSGNKCC